MSLSKKATSFIGGSPESLFYELLSLLITFVRLSLLFNLVMLILFEEVFWCETFRIEAPSFFDLRGIPGLTLNLFPFFGGEDRSLYCLKFPINFISDFLLPYLAGESKESLPGDTGLLSSELLLAEERNSLSSAPNSPSLLSAELSDCKDSWESRRSNLALSLLCLLNSQEFDLLTCFLV